MAIDAAEQAPDSLMSAHEMGRLDFVTALLATITILLAFAGKFAFIDVRRSARGSNGSAVGRRSN
jgi:hypothetical protein